MDIDGLLRGAEVLFSFSGVFFVALGVLLGIVIGATPGLSPSMGVALLVPLSFRMPSELAFIFFVAVYQASNYGGSITAILLNAPGTPSAVVTALDGYPLTQRGKASLALFYAVFASAIGGIIGGVILILFAIPMASFGLLFGPAEYFALALLGLSTVVGFHKGSMWGSLIALSLGLLLSTVGSDPIEGSPRLTFGVFDLYDGVSFIPVMIGFFALAEIFHRVEKGSLSSPVRSALEGLSVQLREVWEGRRALVRPLLQSSLFGTCIGIIPGAGSAVASFLSYGQAQRYAKDREDFGKGAASGLVASEAANSSSVGGALVPLIALGIPGSATDAVLLGALALKGLVAGPELINQEPQLVYGIFLAVLLANLFVFFFGFFGNRLFAHVTRISPKLLYPMILSLSLLGSYTIRNSLLDCWVCLISGGIGWLCKREGIPAAPIVLGLVLGGMLETNLRRVLLAGDGLAPLYERSGALCLLVLSGVFLLSPLLARLRSRNPLKLQKN
ncbi:tripartite tricarboxylate transporter permease [bacterium]|nr:tripartite tricarboxylate transporter permease [bacterium]